MRDDTPTNWVERTVPVCLSGLETLLGKRHFQSQRFVKNVDEYSVCYQSYSLDALKTRAVEWRHALVTETLNRDSLAQTFALIREMSFHTLGMRHYREQLIGAWALMQGMVAEMETGQGKSLTATLAASTAALCGVPTHVITVNDYLAARDAEQMAALYTALGLSVGTALESMSESEKQSAYACDITYCTNKTVSFDHLRDRILMENKPTARGIEIEGLYEKQSRREKLLLPGLCFAIVDEADSVLIDEAATPLVISKNSDNKNRMRIYQRALSLAKGLIETEDFHIIENIRSITLTTKGKKRLELLGKKLGGMWSNINPRDELVIQSLSAVHLFIKDTHYLIHDEKIHIIDEFTGRVMSDRSWQRGLHQLIEVKEGLASSSDRETLARISYQRFFRRYRNIGGMTGTAQEVRSELRRVYGVKTFKIAPAQQVRRLYLNDTICRTDSEKWQLTVDRIIEIRRSRRPILVGTNTLASSEKLSALLDLHGVPHRLLNARQDKHEADVIARAGEAGAITVATNMAGRGTDIKLTDEVKRLGGLHVIATERHQSRRIDRQLFGRCARQGDPGSVETIVSLEDDIVRLNCPKWLVAICSQGPKRMQKIVFTLSQIISERRQQVARARVQKADRDYATLLAYSGKME